MDTDLELQILVLSMDRCQIVKYPKILEYTNLSMSERKLMFHSVCLTSWTQIKDVLGITFKLSTGLQF